MKDKKENEMGAAIKLPLPGEERKRSLTVYVNADLWDSVEKEIKKRKGVSIRKVVEYGLKAYLRDVNPKAAAEFATDKD